MSVLWNDLSAHRRTEMVINSSCYLFTLCVILSPKGEESRREAAETLPPSGTTRSHNHFDNSIGNERSLRVTRKDFITRWQLALTKFQVFRDQASHCLKNGTWNHKEHL